MGVTREEALGLLVTVRVVTLAVRVEWGVVEAREETEEERVVRAETEA